MPSGATSRTVLPVVENDEPLSVPPDDIDVVGSDERDPMIAGVSRQCVDIGVAISSLVHEFTVDLFDGLDHSERIEELMRSIPIEIRADFDIWMAALVEQAVIIAGPAVDGRSDATVNTVPDTMPDPLSAPDVIAAQDRMIAFFDALCPFEPG